jgi:hypothetical protein
LLEETTNPIVVYTRREKKNHRFFEAKREALTFFAGISDCTKQSDQVCWLSKPEEGTRVELSCQVKGLGRGHVKHIKCQVNVEVLAV